MDILSSYTPCSFCMFCQIISLLSIFSSLSVVIGVIKSGSCWKWICWLSQHRTVTFLLTRLEQKAVATASCSPSLDHLQMLCQDGGGPSVYTDIVNEHQHQHQSRSKSLRISKDTTIIFLKFSSSSSFPCLSSIFDDPLRRQSITITIKLLCSIFNSVNDLHFVRIW